MIANEGPIEAALSSDLRGDPHNFSLWDIHTGTQLVIFKGIKSNPIPKCLQLIDNNYFITIIDNVLNVWSIFNKKCQDQKLFLPGRPSTLCVSPCTNYISVGIGELIYIWQLHSGNLLALLQRHYQTISVLKMSSDGSVLLSGGEDGVVLVWPFADVLSGNCNTSSFNINKARQGLDHNEPMFTWQHHSAKITDLHITNGGRCITASSDMSANLYSISDGKRLLCVTLPSPIWSVVMDKNETFAMFGAEDGNIYELALSSISLCRLNTRDEHESSRKPILSGHKGKIVSILISADGTKLITASHDSSCKIWDLQTKKLLRDIKHQAPVANLTSLLIPDAFALSSITQTKTKPPFPLRALKRDVYRIPRESTVMAEDLFEGTATYVVNVTNRINHLAAGNDYTTDTKANSLREPCTKGNLRGKQAADDELVTSLKKKINELYVLSAEKIFKDAAEEILEPYKRVK